jgi:metal transporter CNNM
MTPISDVFMLSIESKLDYETLKQISLTGHSRVPVYEEVDVPAQTPSPDDGSQMTRARPSNKPQPQQRLTKVKKIIGILLVKQCVLLDPKGVCIRLKMTEHVPFSTA